MEILGVLNSQHLGDSQPTRDGKLVSTQRVVPQPTPPSRVSIRVPLTVASVVALITLGLFVQPSLRNGPARLSDSVTENRLAGEGISQSTAERVARARFYDTTVIPLIADVDAENRAAADRCLDRIDHVLDGYHEGVERFVDDMTSISTRLGVLKRMPGGWWASDGRVEAYVQQKFETHLFSEQKLVDDISGALVQFRGEVDANQRRMLIRIQAALTIADLPGVQLDHKEEFFRELSTQLGSYAAGQGTTSVENMLGAFVLGEVGAFAARSIVGGLLVRFAPSVVVGSAAAASATAGASAAGAGGGSFGGPVGAVVGFGAGLAIGLVIDWWMTERFEAELSGQLHLYLEDLEAALISGGTSASRSTTSIQDDQMKSSGSGLEGSLQRVCGQLHDAYRDRFFHQIVDGESL